MCSSRWFGVLLCTKKGFSNTWISLGLFVYIAGPLPVKSDHFNTHTQSWRSRLAELQLFSHEEKHKLIWFSGALTPSDPTASFRAQAKPRPIHRWNNLTQFQTQICKKFKERLSAFTCKYPPLRMICAESEYLHNSTVPFLNLMPKCIMYDFSFQVYSLTWTCASVRDLLKQQTFWHNRRSTGVINNTNNDSIGYIVNVITPTWAFTARHISKCLLWKKKKKRSVNVQNKHTFWFHILNIIGATWSGHWFKYFSCSTGANMG